LWQGRLLVDWLERARLLLYVFAIVVVTLGAATRGGNWLGRGTDRSEVEGDLRGRDRLGSRLHHFSRLFRRWHIKTRLDHRRGVLYLNLHGRCSHWSLLGRKSGLVKSLGLGEGRRDSLTGLASLYGEHYRL